MSSRFDPSLTSKTLNLSLLRFNKRSGFENLVSNTIWRDTLTWGRSPHYDNPTKGRV